MTNYIKNLFKSTDKTANSHTNIQNNLQDDKTIFGFIFKNLDTALLFGMCFLIYAIFDTFTKFVQDNAHFIKDIEERKPFAFTLIFGLMFVEVLLSFATSYFRKHNEIFKSILVTAIALVITYYNHNTIIEIFEKYPQALSIQTKMILANWLIFGLGEVISLLMHSKGNQNTQNPLEEIKEQLQNFQNSFQAQNYAPQNQGILDKNGNPITAQQQQQGTKIGFVTNSQRQMWDVGRTRKASQDQQNEVITLAKQGTPQVEISQKTGLSKYIVSRIINGKY
jgi:hypothetical protein